MILITVTVLALFALTATAVTAATTGWRFGSTHKDTNAAPEMAGPGTAGRGFPGLEGVVTAVDGTAKTITLAGVPGVTTVTIDANVKLTAAQPDGTTKAATITDFKAGQIVRVHGTVDRSQFQPGQRPNPATIKLTVTEIVLPVSGVVRGFGIVTAVSGTTFTVVEMGGLSLSVTPASGATLKKMDGTAFAVGDVKVGDHLGFQGTQSGNAISATNLSLMTAGAFGHGNFGRGPAGAGGPGGPGWPGAPGAPPRPRAPGPPSA